jgi:sugar/nucleoside kinase (ribokinase family)
MKINKILCVGAALCDILLRESDEFLAQLGKEKGGMTLVELSEINQALKTSKNKSERAPGGSACNTGVGLARLGAKVHFLGKRGSDEAGESMEAQLKAWGLQCHLRHGTEATGQVLSIITPDAQRSMMTYLGAAATLSPDEISVKDFEGFDLVHMEGYLLFNLPFAQKVIALAKSAGCKISLDLSSFEVVRIFKDLLADMLKNDIDLIIANEDEAAAYTDASPEASLEIFAPLAEVAVVKLGAEGVLLAQGKQRFKVSANRVKAIDTTGAGDLWASGFLFGLTQGWSLDKAATLGSQTGAAVVQVVGAVIADKTWADIKSKI